jgi:hypothetical protein
MVGMSGTGFALSLEPMTIEEMFRKSEFVGVVHINGIKTESVGQEICSQIYTANVVRKIKGEEGKEYKILQFGRVGGLEINKDYFVFLEFSSNPDEFVRKIYDRGYHGNYTESELRNIVECNRTIPGLILEDDRIISIDGDLIKINYPLPSDISQNIVFQENGPDGYSMRIGDFFGYILTLR